MTCPRCSVALPEHRKGLCESCEIDLVSAGELESMLCPRCGAELPDYDGFGVLAHTKPYYSDGCGFCSHPSRDGGKCGICGDQEQPVAEGGA